MKNLGYNFIELKLRRKNIKVLKPLIKYRFQGSQSEIYEILAEMDGKVKELLLKLYSGANSAIFDPVESILVESQCLAFLDTQGFPVPELIDYSVNGNVGHPWIIISKINGIPAHSYLKKLNKADTYDQVEKYWDNFVDLYVKMHNADIEKLKGIFPRAYRKDPTWYLSHDIELWQTIIDNYPSVSEFFSPVMNWLRAQIKKYPIQKYTFVHRDFFMGNILVDEKSRLHILDPGLAYLTDFRLDLGYTCMGIRNRERDDIFIGISRDGFLKRYEEKSGMRIQHIEFFEVLAFLKNLMIFAMNQLEFTNEMLAESSDIEQINKDFSQFFPTLIKVLSTL